MKTFDQLLEKTAEEVKNTIECLENKELRDLSKNDAIATDWTAYQSYSNPGFFTPFNQKLKNGNTAGVKQAAIATGLLPALKLQNALTYALDSSSKFLTSIALAVNGNWDQARQTAINSVATAGMAIYFSGAFVLNLLKEVTALITRSIATLIDWCKCPAGAQINPTNLEADKQPEVVLTPC